jgi:hypothetical protein
MEDHSLSKEILTVSYTYTIYLRLIQKTKPKNGNPAGAGMDVAKNSSGYVKTRLP